MNLEQEIQQIKNRNAKVESDKAWETSSVRRITIAVITYVVAGATLQLINASNPWLTAFVPTLGWLLSTLTLPPLRRWWLKRHVHLP